MFRRHLLLAGIGSGIAYIVPISTCIKWFPNQKGLVTGLAVAGFNYGGVLVVYAGAVAGIWGAGKVASVYGLLFSANIPGAVAPLIAAYSYDRTGSFLPALVGIAGLLLASTGMLQWQKNAFASYGGGPDSKNGSL